MVHTITPSPDGQYIILKIIGDITRNLAMQYNLEAHKTGEQLDINKYLEDLTESRNVDNPIDSYEFAYDDMQTTPGIDRFARVAVLVSPDDHTHNFIETVTQNTGLDVTLFRDREQAINHLLQA